MIQHIKQYNYLHTQIKVTDKISSPSCQKVAGSITSSKMGNNVANQATGAPLWGDNQPYVPVLVRELPSVNS